MVHPLFIASIRDVTELLKISRRFEKNSKRIDLFSSI